MNRTFYWVAMVAVFLMLGSLCFAKTFQSTWVSPDAKKVNLAGKKVVALVIAKNRSARAAAEDVLVKKITALGPIAVAGNSLLSESEMEDREKAKAKLLAEGCVGALIMRPVVAGDVKVDENPWESPEYRKFVGLTPAESGKKGKKVPFYVEVLLYSLTDDQLMWAGRSATKAVNIDDLMTQMIDGVVENLQKDGLIGKKQ